MARQDGSADGTVKSRRSPQLNSISIDSGSFPTRDGECSRMRSSLITCLKVQARKSQINSKSLPETCSTASCGSAILPKAIKENSVSTVGDGENVARISFSTACHLRSSVKPGLSSDEFMFLLCCVDSIQTAIFQAEAFGWLYSCSLQMLRLDPILREAVDRATKQCHKYQRPLQTLRAAMNESDKNYSARNAKHKPLSGAAAGAGVSLPNRSWRRIAHKCHLGRGYFFRVPGSARASR
jgi:hypothetical protein